MNKQNSFGGMGGQSIRPKILKKKYHLKFKSKWIWPLDPKAMDEKTRPGSLYIVVNQIGEE